MTTSKDFVEKAVEKAMDSQKNSINTALITVPFVEGLAKTKITSYEQLEKHNDLLTYNNRYALRLFGFDSFKDMYYLAKSHEHFGLDTEPVTIKHYNKDVVIQVPVESEPVAKATMANATSQADKQPEDNQEPVNEEPVNPTIVMPFPTVPDQKRELRTQLNGDVWDVKGHAKGVTDYFAYVNPAEGTLVGGIGLDLLKVAKDKKSYGLMAYGKDPATEIAEVSIIADLTRQAIKDQFEVTVDSELFSDKMVPYLVAFGYKKSYYGFYVYDGTQFPEELRVVVNDMD